MRPRRSVLIPHREGMNTHLVYDGSMTVVNDNVLIPHREGMNNSSYAGCKGENLRGQPLSWSKSRSVPETEHRANPLGDGIPVNSRNWN